MKHVLSPEDVEPTLIGGAILGGGGGGVLSSGREVAEAALAVGRPELWSVDEFDPEDLTATVALVGAPAAPDPLVLPRHLARSLDLLRNALPPGRRLAGVNSNENGAYTSFNGWVHSALTGLPVIDLACNGRAHPSSVMGAMGLHRVEGYESIQAYAGGHSHNSLEGVVSGAMDGASSVVRKASEDAGGWIGVARNPVTVDYAQKNGAPGAISFALELGQAHLDGGTEATVTKLGGRMLAEGRVKEFQLEARGGLDYGHVRLDDGAATTLTFANEYMTAESAGSRAAAFPELIMTIAKDGTPITSAEIVVGQELSVIIAPASSLILSPTMFMPELYRPLEEALGFAFAPEARAAELLGSSNA